MLRLTGDAGAKGQAKGTKVIRHCTADIKGSSVALANYGAAADNDQTIRMT